MTDKPIYLLAALSGDIMLIDRVMADYVRTPGSAKTNNGELFWYQTDVRFYDYMESILPQKWIRIALSIKAARYEAIAYCLRKGELTPSRVAALKAFRNVGSKPKALLAAVVREIQWKLGAGAGA